MILPVLILGGGRYLTINGDIVHGRTITEGDLRSRRSIDPDFDPELAAAPGDPVRLTDTNRFQWDLVARTGGHNLRDLLA